MSENKGPFQTVRLMPGVADQIKVIKRSFHTKFIQEAVERSVRLSAKLSEFFPNGDLSDRNVDRMLEYLIQLNIEWPEEPIDKSKVLNKPRLAAEALRKITELDMSPDDAIKEVLKENS